MGDLSDTICALSTPPGRSGIAVVRMSGPESAALAGRIFVPQKPCESFASRHALLGRIIDPHNGSEIDEGILISYRAPHSYTGEDMAEFSLHGSPVLAAALLESLCNLGARLAEPGEFTMRAFLHGRIDLSQAEAVRDIIESTTLYQAQVAARQRSGSLASRLGPLKKSLIDIIAQLESAVEFAEEDLPVASRDTLSDRLEEARAELKRMIDSFHRGRIVRNGFSMAVVGRPNAGKSSLFNALLAQERSIVTDVPGTTRDLVSEFTSIGGIPVRIADTAGIREPHDAIERLGIDRSRQAIADADLVLLVADTSRPLSEEDLVLKEQLVGILCVAALNKRDLPSCWSALEKKEFAGFNPAVEVSAKTMDGVGELRDVILERLLGPAASSQEGILVTNLRHCRNLEEAELALTDSITALYSGLSEEFALADLHRSLRHLGAITGETGVEDILDEIFSQFCVGK